MNLKLRIRLLLTTIYVIIFTNIFSQNTKPNIIIFIADDVSWNDFGCYGNQAVKTPNIDKIAGTSVKFNNAFLTTSSCSPSRVSILTGRYPHNTGAPELHMPILPEMPNLPKTLKSSGYYTVAAGKFHEGDHMKEVYDVMYSRKDGPDGNGDGGENNWVRSIADRPKEKPFFMWYAAHDAHRVWGTNEYAGSNNPDLVRVPPYMVDNEVTRKDFAMYYDEITRFDAFIGMVIEQLKKESILDNTILVIMADNGRPFPRCKTRMYDDGIKTPLIIQWLGGGVLKNKTTDAIVSAIDIMPTLLDMSDVPIPGSVQGKSFKKILKDEKSAFRNLAFAEHNWHDYEAYERMVRTKDFLYIYNARPQYPQSTSGDNHRDSSFQELVKTWKKGKLSPLQFQNFIAPRPFEELYDLQNDPMQLYNVSAEPAYQKILTGLREIKNEWQQQTGDTEPKNLTFSNHDWLMGTFYDETFRPSKRREAPGSSTNAHLINHPGRF
jgi:N-sulfoglucosamine sulfohydrolase